VAVKPREKGQGRTFDSAAMLENGEDLGMSDD